MSATTATTAAVAATAVTTAAGGDISGLFDLVQGIAGAARDGNYWWIISMVVYSVLELLKGRVPGTKIIIPQIPALLGDKLSAEAKKGITLGLSGVVAVIFVISGRPVDAAVADFAQGWIGAMGLHGAVGMVQGFFPKKSA